MVGYAVNKSNPSNVRDMATEVRANKGPGLNPGVCPAQTGSTAENGCLCIDEKEVI